MKASSDTKSPDITAPLTLSVIGRPPPPRSANLITFCKNGSTNVPHCLLNSPVYPSYAIHRSVWKKNSRKFALLVLRAESIRLSKNYCI
jgi:hypothetical protein